MAENKRRKIEIEDGEYVFFENFLSNEDNKHLIKTLKRHLVELEMGTFDLTASFLYVKSTNAFRSVSFNNANCEVVSIKELAHKDNEKLIPAASLFMDGYYVLERFLDDEDPRIPMDPMKRQALRELLQFILSDHSILINDRDKNEREAALAVRLAQHLMIPLVPKKTFVIDAYYAGLQLQQCCSIEHPMNGKKGDTSFGCLEGWHGRVDILMMDKEVPFSVEEDSTEEASTEQALANSEDYSEHSDSSIEIKTDGDFKPDHLEQLMAQTIVFSFLQNKENKGNLKTSLVPGIGICTRKLMIHLYDSVEDVLLEIYPLPLWLDGKEKLNLRAVVILWMTLNYKMFCTGVPAAFKKDKCDFHKAVSAGKLEMYRNEVERPLHVKPSERYLFQPAWSGLLPEMTLKNIPWCEPRSVKITKQL